MKNFKLLFGLLTFASICASCSDEGLENAPNKFPANEAYMNVRLADVGSINTRGIDGGYEYGNANEHAVKDASFYFYDDKGAFVAEGSAWNSGTANSGIPAGNIEFTSNTIVVLKNLTNVGYPKYMVTLLNKPNGFTAPQTLNEMEERLVDGITVKNSETDYFTMSTSSYVRTDGEKYFVTEVKPENFSTEPVVKDPTNYVTVYVERLAAKVTLKASEQLTKVTLKDKENKNVEGDYYEIQTTVAGEDNNNNPIAAEKLYVKFDGWKLNGTTKKSHIVKNIGTTTEWTEANLGFNWNAFSDYRSFWGKSYNYGDNTLKYGIQGETCPLNYVTLENSLVAMEGSSYCAENTNTAEILNTDGNFPAAVTSILLKATVCDANGKALDLVRYNGVLFKKDHFLDYIINVLQTDNNWNVWVMNAEKTAHTQLGKEGIQLVSNGDGSVKVKLIEDQTLYKEVDGENGTKTYETITDQTSINTALAKVGNANAYTDGAMYYNIPIEHLNDIAKDATTLEEANYGVVRNHHYVVTINKLEKLGKGIFDPKEVIIPTKEEDTYYVSAQINILSWKVVNQNVDL